MDDIKIDLSKSLVNDAEFSKVGQASIKALETLHNKTGAGNEYLGWMDLPINYDKNEFLEIKKIAKYVINNCDVFLVIGIGGSFLGAKAAIEALRGDFYNDLSKEHPKVYFIGNNISGSYLKKLLKVIGNKEVCVNVISKSGTTLETALCFRIIREYMENKYDSKESSRRIIVTTDKERGALKQLSTQEGYKTFVIPNNIGGRYSIFTPVGLLPMAVSGIDLDKLMMGILDAYNDYSTIIFEENICCQYAVIRNILNLKGKDIELFVNNEPSMLYISEWWKQLFGESEGKDGKGIFPASVCFTTDLHSMGQYIQEGKRNIFETMLVVNDKEEDIIVTKYQSECDNLQYLEGKGLNYINDIALKGTVEAHNNGGVPIVLINIPKMNEYYFGKLFYFFMKSCAISGYLLGVNPFDQPGVEVYKKSMYDLLKK